MYAPPATLNLPYRDRVEIWLDQRFKICLWIVGILPSTYNAILAMVNAHGFTTPRFAAMVFEVGILFVCLAACYLKGGRKGDLAPVLLIFFALIQMLISSVLNETLYPDFFRNMAIVSAFTSVGIRSSPRQVHNIFRIISIIVLLVLLIELYDTALYVSLFQPASYMQASRGMENFSLNDTGLSAGALGFEGRFSFGIFSGPRTSSIFLEQVSLPGFASVLLIFLLGNWGYLGKTDKIIHGILVILIVLSNNSRTSSALLAINAIGYFVYPYVSGRLTAAIMPFCLTVAFILVGPVTVAAGSDDTVGRLSITVASLMNLSVGDFVAGSLGLAARSYDSGYVYMIGSSSLWGLLVFWLYVTFAPADHTPAQRRVHWGLGVYVFLWLMIGGTAIFTMKTAALLWLVVGNVAVLPSSSNRSSSAEAC